MRGIEEDVIRARSTEIRIIRRQRRAERCRRVPQDRAPIKKETKILIYTAGTVICPPRCTTLLQHSIIFIVISNPTDREKYRREL